MSEMLRSRSEIETALKAAEKAFDGFSRVAEGLTPCCDDDPVYFRAIEDRAIGHGAIVHILQWILGHHDDRGIDHVSVTELQPGVSLVRVFHASGKDDLMVCDSLN